MKLYFRKKRNIFNIGYANICYRVKFEGKKWICLSHKFFINTSIFFFADLYDVLSAVGKNSVGITVFLYSHYLWFYTAANASLVLLTWKFNSIYSPYFINLARKLFEYQRITLLKPYFHYFYYHSDHNYDPRKKQSSMHNLLIAIYS